MRKMPQTDVELHVEVMKPRWGRRDTGLKHPLGASKRRKTGTVSKTTSKRSKTILKPQSVSKLMKEADRLCSLYVRQSNADSNGICTCYTCGYQGEVKKMQNGHFVSRYYKSTRWDLRNCRVQCITCNVWRNGMTPHFAEKLKQELGDGIVEELYGQAREIIKLTPEFLQGIIDSFAAKLEALC